MTVIDFTAFIGRLATSSGETILPFFRTSLSIEDKSPNRLRFDLKRVMRTSYKIDDFQETYFVLDSFDELFEATRRDFAPLYELTQRQPEISPDQIVAGDRVITLGDSSWKQRRPQAA